MVQKKKKKKSDQGLPSAVVVWNDNSAFSLTYKILCTWFRCRIVPVFSGKGWNPQKNQRVVIFLAVISPNKKGIWCELYTPVLYFPCFRCTALLGFQRLRSLPYLKQSSFFIMTVSHVRFQNDSSFCCAVGFCHSPVLCNLPVFCHAAFITHSRQSQEIVCFKQGIRWWQLILLIAWILEKNMENTGKSKEK